MGRSEEELRVEAVRRRLAGEAPERIALAVGRSRRWVSKWVARHEPANEGWAASRRPGRVVNRADDALEAQVVEDPWGRLTGMDPQLAVAVSAVEPSPWGEV